MRICLLILFTFQVLSLFSQIVDIEVLETKGDTIHAKALIKTMSGKIAEERFYRTQEKPDSVSKEEHFMIEQRFFYAFDSVLIYSYNEDWSIQHMDTNFNNDPVYEYTKDEINLDPNVYFLEGRVGDSQYYEFKFHNGTPQDFRVFLESEKSTLEFSNDAVFVPNRSGVTIGFSIAFLRGRNDNYLKVLNSNGSEKFVSIETVGYDLIDDDFSDTTEKIRTKKVKLNDSPDLYLEVKGNFKLLTIINKKGEKKIPVSQLINPISRSYFTKGKNILQLQNLKTGAIKVCRIKIL